MSHVASFIVHINEVNTEDLALYDGHHLLPTTIQESVLRNGEISFTLNRDNGKTLKYAVPALYKLRGGEFKVRAKYANDVIDIHDSPQGKKNEQGTVDD